jgi:2-polyprenyl-3-methyl-5-hydroxy-6-metoxy-1,4-benzoquinol methylase
MKNKKCYLCGSSDLDLIQAIYQKPTKETYLWIKPSEYKREIYKCKHCQVYNNLHDYNLNDLYKGNYNKATYANNIMKNYTKIMNLPFEKSDNKQRVQRILTFCKKNIKGVEELSILDVGSGLCVFLGEIMKFGVIEAHCLDPDPISINHALKNVGVRAAYKNDFIAYNSDKTYDLITFNKVLEHVLNPIELLVKAKSLLSSRGIIYIELPDGKNALKKEKLINREEFYLEHYTIFDQASFKYLIEKAGMRCMQMESIHEPSDKYTIFSFLSK